MIKTAKIIWTVLTLLTLWLAISRGLGTNPEAELLLVIIMIALSFPLGVVMYLFFVVLVEILTYLSINVPEGVVASILLWFMFYLVGYFQWFRLFMWLITWLKKRKANSNLRKDIYE